MKLLIVDDSSVIRKLIEKHLSEFDIDIVGRAANGMQALDIFREKDPDLVTLDITMPEMDGLQVLDEMMKINRKAKVLVITALTDKTTGLQALLKGAKGYLGKPFTPDKLKNSFEKLIGA
jgi:two-component system chemotaxis response regulator CheY